MEAQTWAMTEKDNMEEIYLRKKLEIQSKKKGPVRKQEDKREQIRL